MLVYPAQILHVVQAELVHEQKRHSRHPGAARRAVEQQRTARPQRAHALLQPRAREGHVVDDTVPGRSTHGNVVRRVGDHEVHRA
jgi:hypothetical protein